jgi:REP element-mobilizing transposase RayT
MSLADDSHQQELRAAGWHSRGYLPHFDGREIPQLITIRLFDSVPDEVLQRWRRELNAPHSQADQTTLRKRIEKYADQGYGDAFLRNPLVAEMTQSILLDSDTQAYRLSSWIVMPNHVHFLFTRFENHTLSKILQAFKSLTAHKANVLLSRTGRFWMADYFDRYIRSAEHFAAAVKYIEANPVRARLCARPEDSPFSSARFHGARTPTTKYAHHKICS